MNTWTSDGDLILDSENNVIATLNIPQGKSTTDDEKYWDSIASLITAAPLLLEAIEDLYYTFCSDPRWKNVLIASKAKEAIYQATGEEV